MANTALDKFLTNATNSGVVCNAWRCNKPAPNRFIILELDIGLSLCDRHYPIYLDNWRKFRKQQKKGGRK